MGNRYMEPDVNGLPMQGGTKLLSANGNMSSVGTSGTTVELDFAQRARIERVVVVKTAGSCTSFNIFIYDKETPDTVNISYQVSGAVDIHDQVENLLFFNRNTDQKIDKLYLKIVPNSGSDNDFDYNILGVQLS